MPEQVELDARNAAFWDELCGSAFARRLGITDASPESLARFDAAYLAFYPYLSGYVEREAPAGRRVLEVGLGYGTLGELIARRGGDYHGLDIAEAPVEMTRERLRRLGFDESEERVQVGSALAVPHPDESFDLVYSIGCLHHTGDLRRAVAEVHRVLRPGGVAIVMLYHRYSVRRVVAAPLLQLAGRLRPGGEGVRALFDQGLDGEAAPHTEYVSRRGARRLFAGFADVRIRAENFDSIPLPRGLRIPRTLFLKNLARVVGVDLYVRARK
jgi:SAM-dependent methyltransferase